MRKRAVCGMCQGGCDVVVTVRGRSDRPRLRRRGIGSRAALLAWRACPDALYGEQRIMHPMVRDAGRANCGAFHGTRRSTDPAELVRAVVEAGGPCAMASVFRSRRFGHARDAHGGRGAVRCFRVSVRRTI